MKGKILRMVENAAWWLRHTLYGWKCEITIEHRTDNPAMLVLMATIFIRQTWFAETQSQCFVKAPFDRWKDAETGGAVDGDIEQWLNGCGEVYMETLLEDLAMGVGRKA